MNDLDVFSVKSIMKLLILIVSLSDVIVIISIRFFGDELSVNFERINNLI